MILPGYIKPEYNELFSSWLIRLSYEHRIKSYSFSKFYFNGHPIWNRDIDRMSPNSIINILKKITPLNDSQIRNLFLISYKGKVFNENEISRIHSGILPLGIYHRKRFKYGLLCCPSCLNNPITYFKKEWRIFYSIVCTECLCELIDRCPKCFFPISFYRLETGYKNKLLEHPLYLCHNCLYDLRKATNFIHRNSLEMSYQNYINDTIENGFNNISGYSFTYLNALLLITTKLCTKSSQWNRIKKIAENAFHVSINNDIKIDNDIKERKKVLLISHRILDNWPNNFHSIFNNSNVRYSDFSKDSGNLPYWLVKSIRHLT